MSKLHTGGSDLDARLLHTLIDLPHRILQSHDSDELSPIVLHDLGHDHHFGLNKAVYLVDNPDFDCLRGVAGFCRDECKFHKADVWEKPHEFAQDMASAEFHQLMKKFSDNSISRQNHQHTPESLALLGQKLGIKNPSCCVWNMKHGNHGILIFEEHDQRLARQKDLINKVTALLSLC